MMTSEQDAAPRKSVGAMMSTGRRTMGRMVRAVATVVGVTMVAVALTPLPAVAAGDPFVQPTTTSAADEQLLATVSLQPGDVQPPAAILPYQSATTVRGQVSLNLCGAEFPSEALRAGRRQVGVYAGQSQVFSVEAILYRDDAAAAQALAELTRARKACPKGFVSTGVRGDALIKNHFNHVAKRYRRAVSGVERVAFDITQTTQDGRGGETLVIYQRRGPIVVGLYSMTPLPDNVVTTPIDGISGLANTLAQRLQAAPTSGVTI
jgi:hypothetical protein